MPRRAARRGDGSSSSIPGPPTPCAERLRRTPRGQVLERLALLEHRRRAAVHPSLTAAQTSKGTPVAGAPTRGAQLLATAAAQLQAQPRDQHQRLEGDRKRHLALTRLAVAERDRHLGDREAGQQRAIGELDVEDVALSAQGRRLDRLEDLTAHAAKPAGQVVDPNAEYGSGVHGAEAAEEPSQPRPVHDLTAVDVARAENEVARLG